VPFSDERRPVSVVPYQPEWEAEFSALAERIWALQLAEKGEVEHVGSTSVPHLAAKDVIDVQVRVDELDPDLVTERFVGIGFRRRPEAWNNLEDTRRGPVPKLVFAPPVDARHVNVHVRVDGSQGACDTLLFRDFLRAEAAMREAWGRFKVELAGAIEIDDLEAYGRVKGPAWLVLMRAADAWAEEVSWSPVPLRRWRQPGSPR
jgi:GrpB-like predicted nucleotidyltransferase (UPF0157 family)